MRYLKADRVSKNNTSGYRGVRWDAKRQRFIASIEFGGRRKQLGSFFTAEEAAAAYRTEHECLYKPHALDVAIAENASYYFTGEPCKNGHIAKRVTSTRQCTECTAVWAASAYKRNDGAAKARAWRASWTPEQREKHRVINANGTKAWRKKNPKKHVALTTLHKKTVRQRTPAWADIDAIKRFYENCPPEHHVDHIYPMRGDTVSGLHVLENLQYLPATENLRKNKKLPDLEEVFAVNGFQFLKEHRSIIEEECVS